MEKNKRYIYLLLTLMIYAFAAEAQEHRFVVFFKDKANSPYSLEAPEAFLSERAIERRHKQSIPVIPADLPVSPAYLDSLREEGVAYYHKSKWFNGVLVQTDSATIAYLLTKPYVRGAVHVAPGVKLTHPIENTLDTGTKISGNLYTSGAHVDYNNVTMEQNELLDVPTMHSQGYRGEGIIIAVLDGGFMGVDIHEPFQHLYNEKRIVATRNYVVNDDSVYQYSDHGTKALSTIAAVIPDKFIGTAPKASFILSVTEDVDGEYQIEEYNWLFAAEFADSAGADIVSTSLGYSTFSDPSMNYTYEEMDGETSVITRAADIAASKGMVMVTSAGNEGNKQWKYISAPADGDSVLAVGALRSGHLSKTGFSSFGPSADGRIKPDVMALGEQVLTVNANGRVVRSNGTSFSAPLISGLIAGFWQANPDLTNMQVIDRIRKSGHRALAPNNEVGYGLPNFTRAMNKTVLATFGSVPKSFRVFPNPVSNELVIEVKSNQVSDGLAVYLYSSTGKLLGHKEPKGYSQEIITFDFHNILPGVYIINVVTANTSEAVKVVKF